MKRYSTRQNVFSKREVKVAEAMLPTFAITVRQIKGVIREPATGDNLACVHDLERPGAKQPNSKMRVLSWFSLLVKKLFFSKFDGLAKSCNTIKVIANFFNLFIFLAYQSSVQCLGSCDGSEKCGGYREKGLQQQR